MLSCFAGKKMLQNEVLHKCLFIEKCIEKTGFDTPQECGFSIHNFLPFVFKEILSLTNSDKK